MLEQQEETQEDIAEEEEKQQTFTIEYMGTALAGFKTLMYAYMGIMAGISVFGITWKHKTPPTTHTPPPRHTPPAKEQKRASMFKEKSDPFVIK